MKTLLFCLLMLSNAGISTHTNNYPKPGGVSVLTVDPAVSTINWKAEKPTGKHNGTIRIQSGDLVFYCKQLAKGSITIDMNSITVCDLVMLDKQKLENNLKGDNFFDTDSFPLAKLDIVSVDHRSESVYHFVTVTGNLMLHGISKKVVFTVDISKNTDTSFMAQADIKINRRDWNIATKNVKYDTFIYSDINLHVLLQANKANTQTAASL
ncbi:YceI family protein [Mucilaginibacter sp. McL0603]|uniref:YceI family protein n=1 Tax=Mucilaginibacter sp. McL0603 TaxID=3415670 RepID=UPI003CF33621